MAQSHTAVSAIATRQVEEKCATVCEWLFPPHPGPLPQGEGESFAMWAHYRSVWKGYSAERATGTSPMSGIVESCSLSPRERAKVRGNETLLVGMPWTFPTIIELSESPGGAGGFPTK